MDYYIMPNSHEFVANVNQLLSKLDESGDLNTGLEVAGCIIKLLGLTETSTPDSIIDEHVLQLPNAERYDHWFQNHPWMGGERAVFEIIDANSAPIQAKFYWLQKRSRQFVAGAVHFTENWEDAEYTHNNNFKVGIDFFLSPNGKSLLVTLSNRSNIRIVELQHKLNNTQVDIFTKWRDAVQISSIEALHNTLWNSFMLQSVNKEFYRGVSNSFTELLQHLKGIGKDEEAAKLFSSRLLGRLLFVWFLRKKNIIDESMGYFDAIGLDSTDYYRKSLERLFFNTLNLPIDERDEFKNETQKRLFPETEDQPQVKLFQIDQKTPYLNGGLFEAHDNDWYRDSNLTFPDGFFTNLYDHFDQFNFTTDESTPEYEQVAIDPEMLGRVFESLLATQVDEAGQQARKAKGAFYTPREVVSYMCRESLRNYLYSVDDNDERYKKSIDDLLDRSDHGWAGAGTNSKRDAVPKEYRITIIDTLDKLTVLDPACGSGAYPMGMLQLIVKTYERLEGRFDQYKTKLQIIQNNIFGVDIEPMAVEISRLRAWLSLIVDEEDSQIVAPLPNLDFKFVCANSLLSLDRNMGIFSDSELHQKLKDIRVKYFNARIPKSKKKFQTEYHALADSKQQSLTDDKRTRQLKSFDPFKNSQAAMFFDTDQMFGLDDKFDIVIGNPPYVQLQKNGGVLADAYKNEGYETFARTGDIYSLFYERGLELTKPKTGLLCYITSNKWMRAGYGEKTRLYFTKKNPIHLIDFGGFKVFESATVDTNILLVQNSNNKNQLIVSHFKNDYKQGQSIREYFITHSSDLKNIDSSTWFIGDNAEQLLKEKIERLGTPLKNWNIKINSGIKTGCNEAFIIDETTKNRLISEDAKSEEIIRPLLRGRDIKRYSNDFQNIYILATGFDTDIKTEYSAIYDYIKSVGEKIDRKEIKSKGKGVFNRGDQGNNWWNLRACSYYDEFEKKKIIYSEIVQEPQFCLDISGEFYAEATSFILTGPSLDVLTGILNSKAATYFFKRWYAGGGLGGAGLRYKKAFLENLPVPKENKTNTSTYTKLSATVTTLTRIIIDGGAKDQKAAEDMIDQLVYQLYNLNSEEIAIIEGSTK